MRLTSRGQLQQLQKDAAVFCGMTVVFCRRLRWELLAAALEDLSARLALGAQRDVLPLVRLGPELTPARARVLLQHDICNAEELLRAGLARLAALLLETLPFDAQDPLTAGSRQAKSGDGDGGGGGGGRGAVTAAGARGGAVSDRAQLLCERLARKILIRSVSCIHTDPIPMLLRFGSFRVPFITPHTHAIALWQLPSPIHNTPYPCYCSLAASESHS